MREPSLIFCALQAPTNQTAIPSIAFSMDPEDLPATFIDTRFSPTDLEAKWRGFWDEHQLWRADEKSQKPPFCMVLPPPNITGVLHMGHALTISIEDSIARYKRMRGFEVLWVPGLDHAGIATQTVVERDLLQKENKTRHELGREGFIKRIWEWKERHQIEILDQIKHLGASCDWSRLCFSLDEERSKAVHQAFKILFDQGLIYRGNYLVNWDPIAQTALADDEVEHEERQTTLWQIRYRLEFQNQGESLIAATTRPETLLGDVALAVHPDDQRYSHLIGTSAMVPLVNRRIQIVADGAVDISFGTGVVKITPAHDPLDYQIGERHQLEPINVIAEDGSILLPPDALHLPYGGLKIDQARAIICRDLQEGGHIAGSNSHRHRVGLSYRSKAVIEPRLSQQWFFKLSSFRAQLREAIESDGVQLMPESWRATYFHWVDGLRDWCISRQLWWGHRIPIWRHEITGQMICPDLDAPSPKGTHWKRDEDVLDTWFSSALWPMSALGWPEKSALFSRFYPNALLETGCDILFFWVARMAIMGRLLSQQWPFQSCYLHGLIYAKSYWRQSADGQITYASAAERKGFDLGQRLPKDVMSRWEKMSKSKQNVLNPKEITGSYGVDAARLALITSLNKLGQIDLDMRKFEEYRHFTNKLWNASRFVLISLQLAPSLTKGQFSKGIELNRLPLEDRWILARLRHTCSRYHSHFDRFDLSAAAEETCDFFWSEFCAIYIEIAKKSMQQSDTFNRRAKQQILAIVLIASLRLLHPMIPFITEELFRAFKDLLDVVSDRGDLFSQDSCSALSASCCMASSSPQFQPPTTQDFSDDRAFQFLLKIVRSLRNLRAELKIPKATSQSVSAIASDDLWALIDEHRTLLNSLVPKTQLMRASKEPSGTCGVASIQGVRLYMQMPQKVRLSEIDRIERELPKIEVEIAQVKGQLADAAFREKAPGELVKKREDHLIHLSESHSALSKMLNRLQSEQIISKQ